MTHPVALCSSSFVARAVAHDYPFRWIETPGIFDPAIAAELSRTFPDEALTLHERVEKFAEKQYRMRSLVVADVHDAACGQPGFVVSKTWTAVQSWLLSPGYRASVELLTNLDLSRTKVQVRLCSYDSSHWMGPHTDRPETRATHVIYLSREWDSIYGGALQLHCSPAADDVARRVYPLWNTGVLLVRSDESWHSVEPVRECTDMRRSILIHFVAQ